MHGTYQARVQRGKLAEPFESVDCTEQTVLIACRTRQRAFGSVSLEIEGTAHSKAAASSTAARASRALQTYVRRQQDAAKIARAQRVVFVVVDPAAKNVERLAGHRVLGPLVALALILALLGPVTMTSARAGRPS